MENEYGIPIDSKMKEGIGEICNLSQGIRKEGRAVGRAEGKAEVEAAVINRRHENGFTVEQIMMATGKSAEEVNMIIKKRASVSFA